jgi:hypothetical protein
MSGERLILARHEKYASYICKSFKMVNLGLVVFYPY